MILQGHPLSYDIKNFKFSYGPNNNGIGVVVYFRTDAWPNHDSMNFWLSQGLFDIIKKMFIDNTIEHYEGFHKEILRAKRLYKMRKREILLKDPDQKKFYVRNESEQKRISHIMIPYHSKTRGFVKAEYTITDENIELEEIIEHIGKQDWKFKRRV
ncbi:hypothetical protein [Paenibacillus sp. An7]|uniref:hypothetical protein n=1 Tax=Paenibacillus sp. An7 TaxID=2689577 RepID=UPI001359B0E8|nr:hypothetical protein [Paenibacillus sp. An7]